MKESNQKGMKCGIEIHQQLDTHKLFCSCPSILRNDEPKFQIKRKLHAVKGESGVVDNAAKYEAVRDREFIYQAYDTTCLVELDEEPPHMINQEALQIALHIALHLNCEILPVTMIMRKTVVDGSNTSGFQRTALIARNGFVETSFGKVRIAALMLEEDSARPVIRDHEKAVYRLDRLGLPLVEIATEADIYTPEQCKETALHIGEILRSCKVKRGIGTIRQDINISIPGHPRVEIKGFQDVKLFHLTIDNELKRQKKMIEITEELKKRKIIIGNIIELTDEFKNSKVEIIKKALLNDDGFVVGVKITNAEGILGTEFYNGRRFGSEVSDYAKTLGAKGIIHSDEDLKNKYNFSDEEIKIISKKLELLKKDSFIIIAEKKEIAEKSLINAITRIRKQAEVSGVSEVRDSKSDGSTCFLRPMPGSARMYPETDSPLLYISRDIINNSKNSIPKLISNKRETLKQKGLNEELIKLVLEENKLEELEALLKIINDPSLIVKALIIIPREIEAKEKKDLSEIITLDVVESIIDAVSKGKISKEDIKNVMIEIAKGKSFEDAIKIEKEDLSNIESEILNIVKEKQGLSIGGYMGLIMEKYKGKISGKDATLILNKILEQK